MKQQARKGIFETNSPFTHTLSLYNKKELEVLRNRNDVWLDFYGKREIITREQIENSKSDSDSESLDFSAIIDDDDDLGWLSEL